MEDEKTDVNASNISSKEIVAKTKSSADSEGPLSVKNGGRGPISKAKIFTLIIFLIMAIIIIFLIWRVIF
jgi:hypothetical protein